MQWLQLNKNFPTDLCQWFSSKCSMHQFWKLISIFQQYKIIAEKSVSRRLQKCGEICWKLAKTERLRKLLLCNGYSLRLIIKEHCLLIRRNLPFKCLIWLIIHSRIYSLPSCNSWTRLMNLLIFPWSMDWVFDLLIPLKRSLSWPGKLQSSRNSKDVHSRMMYIGRMMDCWLGLSKGW